MKLTLANIFHDPIEQVADHRSKLQIDKMKMDRFFSVFLDKAKFDEENLDTPEWFTYREMLKEYDKLSEMIKAANYRLGTTRV